MYHDSRELVKSHIFYRLFQKGYIAELSIWKTTFILEVIKNIYSNTLSQTFRYHFELDNALRIPLTVSVWFCLLQYARVLRCWHGPRRIFLVNKKNTHLEGLTSSSNGMSSPLYINTLQFLEDDILSPGIIRPNDSSKRTQRLKHVDKIIMG